MDRGDGACGESAHVSNFSASPLKVWSNTSAPISEARMTSQHRLRFSRLASRAQPPYALAAPVPVHYTEVAKILRTRAKYPHSPVCCDRLPTSFLRLRSHTLTNSSSLPVANHFPPGLAATAFTHAKCAGKMKIGLSTGFS